MKIHKFVIFDIDGTISNDGHRRHHAVARDWDAYHENCIEDPIFTDVADLLRVVSFFSDIILVTGRNEKYRAQTLAWLKLAGLDTFVSELIMRPDGNYQHSAELKAQQLLERFGSEERLREKIWFIVEDNDKNTEVFRNMGLTVLQSAPDGH